jgi:glycosyltransferase involved in cell wall biosynthesis
VVPGFKKIFMRIAMLVSNLSVSGGYQKLVLRLHEELLNLGHEVITYTPFVNKKNCYPEIFSSRSDIKIISLENKEKQGNLWFSNYIPQSWIYYKMSKKILPFDALLVHNEDCLTALNFIRGVSQHSFSSIWMLNNQLPQNISSIYKKAREHFRSIKNIRVILYVMLTFPALIIDSYLKILGLRKVKAIACYDLFNCELVKKILHKETQLVYAGADLSDYKKIHSSRIRNGKAIHLLSVGVLFPYRRYEDIINALHLLTTVYGLNIFLDIVGKVDYSPEYYNFLKRLIEEKHLAKRVTFMGTVTDQRMFEIFKHSHIYCFVNDSNSWGISVFEAVAAGMPVIISNNIGAVDIINSQLGWVVPPCNAQSIADSVWDIVQHPLKVEKVTVKAKRKISNLLSWKSYCRRMIKLF